MTISSKNLENWPSIAELAKRAQSLAALDAILERDWELRYYSFDAHWDKGEKLASMRDGQGSFFFILFSSVGAIVKGFDRDSTMGTYNLQHGHPWPGVVDSVPPEFSQFLQEPAFYVNDATFCIWRTHTDAFWNKGPVSFPREDDPDGSNKLLYILDGNPKTFHKWAEYYHERRIPLSAVESVYAHEVVDKALLGALGQDAADMSEINEEMRVIGYPNP